MERRDATAVSTIQERGVGVEEGADGVGLSERRCPMNRVIGGLCAAW